MTGEWPSSYCSVLFEHIVALSEVLSRYLRAWGEGNHEKVRIAGNAAEI